MGRVLRSTAVLVSGLLVLTVACGSERESGGSAPFGSPAMRTTTTSGSVAHTAASTPSLDGSESGPADTLPATILAGTVPATSAPAATVPAATVPATSVPSRGAACDVESILPVVTGLFPENEAWKMIDVDIANCGNGYARVFAVPDQGDCPDGSICRDNEQVFLRVVDGAWVYLDSGTGIECPDPFVIDACEALGLP